MSQLAHMSRFEWRSYRDGFGLRWYASWLGVAAYVLGFVLGASQEGKP